MSAKCRLRNKEGRWAMLYDAEHIAWLCSDYVVKIILAAQSEAAGPELRELASLLAQEELVEGAPLVLPLPAEMQREFESREHSMQGVADAELQLINGVAARYKAVLEEDVRETLDKALVDLKKELSPKKPQAWIFCATARMVKWTRNPARAQMFSPSEADHWLERCARGDAIAALLGAGEKQARKVGTVFEDWEFPAFRKPSPGAQSCVSALAERFDASSAYMSTERFAIYAESAVGEPGFLTYQDGVKADLGSARLFPSIEEARRCALARFPDCALVRVDLAPQSFEVVGEPKKLHDLQAVMCAKEELDLGETLKTIDVDSLRAELAAREKAQARLDDEAAFPSGL